jgi:adenylate kinase
MIITVMGPQGSGKSTQAVLLAKKLSLPLLQSGEVLRQLAEQKTKTGKRVKSFLDQGKLVDDRLLFAILKTEASKEAHQKGFVLDGTPRTLAQAQNLPFQIDQAIYLRVRDEENIKRLLLRKREDDTPAVIAARLRLYHQETEPVLNFYRELGLLIEVDGERSIADIHQDILNKLEYASEK